MGITILTLGCVFNNFESKQFHSEYVRAFFEIDDLETLNDFIKPLISLKGLLNVIILIKKM